MVWGFGVLEPFDLCQLEGMIIQASKEWSSVDFLGAGPNQDQMAAYLGAYAVSHFHTSYL